MKSITYYNEKNDRIVNSSVLVGLMLDKIPNGDYKDVVNLKLAAVEFLSLTPDPQDTETDEVFVASWKGVYKRLTKTIQDIKNANDYRLDWKKNEVGKVANALLASRRATPWIK